jgi:hypothetical protein
MRRRLCLLEKVVGEVRQGGSDGSFMMVVMMMTVVLVEDLQSLENVD